MKIGHYQNAPFRVLTQFEPQVQRVAGDAGLVIMIARLGKGETKRDLNRRRLNNARTFLIEFGQRAPQTIVTAEGERVNGYGRVELYAGGKLFHVLMINPNDDLAVGACSFEGDDPCTYEREKKLYPCLDRNSRKRESEFAEPRQDNRRCGNQKL
jgi:hypothetical protein